MKHYVPRTLSITVYPSALGAEYLTVSDAMRQILDLVEALEHAETLDADTKKIVWRLTEAHTNSPPFTATIEAFPVDPAISVGLEADRVIAMYSVGMESLLNGDIPDWIDSEFSAPLKRVFKRNLNGVGQTSISVRGESPLTIVPSNAHVAIAALDRFGVEEALSAPDWRRTEYGAVEGLICGLTHWNGKPALLIIERLSEQKVTCVLSPELAAELGPEHSWAEAWQGRRLEISGALHYSADGFIRRIDVHSTEDVPWTEVSISELKDINILRGKTVRSHLREMWGDDDG